MTKSCNTEESSRALLYIYDGLVVLLRRAFYAEKHSHHSIQIVISLENPFQIECNDQTLECSAVVIPPDRPHQVRESFGWHVTILIEPESLHGRRLTSELSLTTSAHVLSMDKLENLLDGYRSQAYIDDVDNEGHWDFIYQHTIKLLGILSKPIVLTPLDARVKQVMTIIEAEPDSNNVRHLEFPDIPLSKSRLAHLFVEQTGIPLSKYVLWVRIKRAAEQILAGASFTETAHQAGFSDLPHLSRTFKRMFGLTMSNLFQDNERVHLVTSNQRLSGLLQTKK
ncbi:helix-turn-helix domain-containing protein [Litoribacillus peritrichatus]